MAMFEYATSEGEGTLIDYGTLKPSESGVLLDHKRGSFYYLTKSGDLLVHEPFGPVHIYSACDENCQTGK